MAEETLVERKLEDGADLIQELQSRGFDVSAAFWMQEEGGYWYLYLVSKTVDDEGDTTAHRRLTLLLRQIKESSIDPFELTLIGTDSPLAQEVLDLQHRYPLNLYSQHRLRKVGPMRTGEAHIYPLVSVP
jgi:hypothetical protein